MKKIENKYTSPRVDDYIFHVPIKEIVPGDKLIIYDTHTDHSTYWKVVTVPDSGLIITKFGNIIIEGEHTENLGIDWLPKFSYNYFFGLISVGSFEKESFIGFFAQGEFEDDFISHLLKPNKEGKLMVLKNVEKLKSFFPKERMYLSY